MPLIFTIEKFCQIFLPDFFFIRTSFEDRENAVDDFFFFFFDRKTLDIVAQGKL